MRRLGSVLALRLVSALAAVLLLPTYGVSFIYSAAADLQYAGRITLAERAVTPEGGSLRTLNATAAETTRLLAAFERIDYPLPSDLTVTVVLADRLGPGIEGVYDTVTGKIYLHRETNFGAVLPHELGHAVEMGLLTAPGRARYEALRGLPSWAKWGGSYRQFGSWERKASEDFAEVFAQIFSPDSWFFGDVKTVFGPITNPEELRAFYISLTR